ncbi:MAG: glycosyltransferase [Chlorobi bacterium]|nr:glycosyltransferase [Chlorobiota bacterium]
MQTFAASVIVSFFEKPDFLEKVLTGFTLQNFKDFEILIADDGSGEKTVGEIRAMIHKSKISIRHIHHENKGWRKNRILNQAILASKSNYLIFTDGDCIPHHAFVAEHLDASKPDTVLTGRRVYLGAGLSKFLTSQRIRRKVLKRFGLFLLVADRIAGGSSHIENGIYFKNPAIRRRINRKDKGILGSNFSLHKKTLFAVNGFDERYESPAVGEDTDLEYRLRNAGYHITSVKHLAIQYHLCHEVLKRDSENLKLLEEVIREKTTKTPYGINKESVS